jgi:site-specific DNA-methyltransferase (adenine-specific)
MRVERIGNATLYMGDCLEILPTLPKVDAVITDPPYPNGVGHFDEWIETARRVIADPRFLHVMAFWDEMEVPHSRLPLVAKHVWHRTNTNRPDNYEAIYEWCADGVKRASRVFPFPVVAVGLTGCVEATGHPTQKNQRLMRDLVERTFGTVLDPFMGSGTTGVACMQLGRKFIGIEIEPKYFDIACERIENAQRQETLFDSASVKHEQMGLV